MSAAKMPPFIVLEGRTYVLQMCLVNTETNAEKYKGKRPKNLSMIGMDEKIELAGGEKFITVYVPLEASR